MTGTPIFTLRPASAEDFAFLADLHVRTMKPYVAQTWGWDDEVQARMFRAGFDPRRVQIVVAEGRDCGMLVLERSADRYYLAAVEIDPGRQRRGLGTAIVRRILAEAAQAGLPVELRVLKVNPARGLYARLGFAVIGEIATHHLMRAPARPDE